MDGSGSLKGVRCSPGTGAAPDSAIGLSACTSASGPGQDGFGGEGGPGNRGGGPGSNGNLTEEERQQLMQERMLAGIAACDGKGEGDSCSMQGLGNETAGGTCKSMNGTLSCGFGAGGGQGGMLPPRQ